MSRSALTTLMLSALALTALPTPASAFGWRYWRWSAYYRAPVVVAAPPVLVVAAPPVYCLPAATYAPSVLAPSAAPRPLAQPVPAPPSGGSQAAPRTQEPPLSAPPPPTPASPGRSPGVTESRSYFNSYALAGADLKPAGDRCRVSFWNLTDGPVTVKVGDQAYSLSSNSQSQNLDLQRQFVWRVDDREPQWERVADGESGLVIVIRR